MLIWLENRGIFSQSNLLTACWCLPIQQESGLWRLHGVLASYCHNGWQWGKPSNYALVILVSYILLNWDQPLNCKQTQVSELQGNSTCSKQTSCRDRDPLLILGARTLGTKKISLMGLFCTEPESWTFFFFFIRISDCPSSKANPSQNELRMLCVQSFYRIAPKQDLIGQKTGAGSDDVLC